jgi:hypothetical protein
MQGSIAEHLSSDHYENRAEECLARSAGHQWPIGPAILLMVASSALLWTAIYLGVREIL